MASGSLPKNTRIEMTKLEEELLEAIKTEMRKDDTGFYCLYEGGESNEAASLAAQVALKYIEKAYKDALTSNFKGYPEALLKEEANQWLKENGLTP